MESGIKSTTKMANNPRLTVVNNAKEMFEYSDRYRAKEILHTNGSKLNNPLTAALYLYKTSFVLYDLYDKRLLNKFC